MFWGRFRRGVDDDLMDVSFPYLVIDEGPSRSIWVRLYRHPVSKRNWVFMHSKGC
jgi:hypothetical protein